MIPGLSNLLEYFQNERHARTNVERNILEAIHKAVHETNKYLRNYKPNSVRNTDVEMELSNLWALAAIAARDLSKKLAEKYYIKSNYWRDPDKWTFSRIRKSGIALEDIEKELMRLIIK